jgi:hypothetical protein
VDDFIKPRCSSRPGLQHVLLEALGEDAATAQNGVAVKATRQDDDPNRPIADRQVPKLTSIPAVDPVRNSPTSWALAGFSRRSHGDHRTDPLNLYAFNNEPTRHQTRRSEG